MQRVLIVGAAGAGKTTVARALRNRLQLPHVELDALHWGPDWTPREDFVERVEDAVTGERWIIDGGYWRAAILAWNCADCVVWVDYAFPVMFAQLAWRTLRRVAKREELFAGNRESFRQALFSRRSILWWLVKTHRGQRRQYQMLADAYPNVPVIRLRSRREAARWLDTLPGTVSD